MKKIIGLLFTFGLISYIGNTFAINETKDIMDIMFQPAIAHEKLIDIGSTKQAVGDDVFRGSITVTTNDNMGRGCFVKNQWISQKEIENEMNALQYKGLPSDFCQKIKGGDQDTTIISTQVQDPLLVRITKFLLRMTIVLSVTMIIYNGILWIIESSKGGEVKDAKNNITYIFVGILLSLSSVILINLISSLGVSSLDPNKVIQTPTTTVVDTTQK